MNALIFIVIVIVILALCLYGVDQAPIEGPFKGWLKFLLVVIAVVLLVQKFAILG